MTQEGERSGATSGKKSASRPSLASQASFSVPSTPRQYARDPGRARTPSPRRLPGRHSPNAAAPGSSATMPFLKPTVPTCRFQSTQTSRRRIKYTIGSDMLEPDSEAPKPSLDVFEEKKLGAELKALYDHLLPTSESQASREAVVEKLKNILREEWPDRTVEVSVFGSSGNLLNTNQSDVDICITVTSLETVCSLAEVLARRGMKNVTCVHAKAVPIVKIWDPQYQMACDLNVNNHVALKNTRMVKTYMELDERVRPLALIIKYWTKRRILNEASGGTLSSYTWTLLVIHFLQTRSIPVLPVLAINDQDGKPRQSFAGDLQKYRGFGESNKESLAELFFYFFRRYGHEIDYESAVMSVRHGKILTKKEKNWHLMTNNRLCVEEPFNTDRNLGNTADDTAVRGLHLELRQAFSRVAEGKHLDSVCEQYEYPADDPKPIFERPQPGPRPILSRSTSQSGRGGRRRGGGRGNHEYRGGGGARRSSSAATFGHPAFLGVHSPGILMPGSEYFFGTGAPMFSAADLETLSRQIDQKQQQLRMQQLHIQHAQMQAQAQAHAQALAANQQRSSSASTPLQQYQRLQNGSFSSPHLQPAELAPTSAPLNAPYPYNTSAESSVPMSHSSSAQDSGSHSNSPRMAPATPQRRGFQRGLPQVSSPGGTARSQSQPARAAGQANGQGSTRSQYATPSMQHQFPVSAARPYYLGPYMGPYGSYYLAAPPTESLPREYLGYGIGAPQYAASMPDQSQQMPIPTYEELIRQGRHLSPSRRHSTMVGADLQLRSSSPHSQHFSDTTETAIGSPTISTDHGSLSQEQHTPRILSEDPPPLVANGSNYTNARSVQDAETRRVSEPSRRPTFGSELDGNGNEPQIHRTQSNQSFAARIGASIAATEKARKEKMNFYAADDSDRETGQRLTSNKKASSQQEMPPPPRPSESRAHMSPETANGVRRPSGSSRAPIAALDLGQSYSNAADRLRETQLSPVEERRTPSPAWHRNSLPVNGIGAHSLSSLADAVARSDRGSTKPPHLPTPPTPYHGHENSSRAVVANGSGPSSSSGVGTNSTSGPGSFRNGARPSTSPHRGGVGRARPLSQTFLPSETSHLPSAQVQTQAGGSSWTQAGKGKKKKGRNESGGGQVMPENISERKGG